ncbi:MAG: HPr family phosphocarrier protein [Candidatus Phaeomarinobacter sp.]
MSASDEADGSAAAGAPLSRELTITNARGLHARASARFVNLAESFDADIRVSRDGQKVAGTSIMGLMMLAASKGCGITIEASGLQAESALDALSKLVTDNFGEE